MKRKKINKNFNNNGFTLIELIAVIVLVAAISVLSFASITKTIKNSELKEIEVFETSLKNATQVYIETNLTDFPELNTTGGSVEISATTLISENYLDKSINNPTDCSLSNSYITAIKQEDKTIEYTVSCEEEIIEETPPTYANGEAVYFNPESGTKCTAGEAVSVLGTKTGCMKWYIFNYSVSSTTVDMILDHNTTFAVRWNSTGSSVSGPTDVLTQLASDTNSWIGVPTRSDSYSINNGTSIYTIDYGTYKARLITASEIATITGNSSFNEVTATTSNNFFFDTNNDTPFSPSTFGQPDYPKSNYAWLFDYTDCYGFGCNIAEENVVGYWTSTAVADSSLFFIWSIHRIGSLNYDLPDWSSDVGVRPVITISKSIIE